ncbi:hypothetical protein F4604DRAFT_1958814 [Suillus subluteus]|nr:hypothetical protein F4604DRAFT_1958814 [Suillus subluteus]
MSHDKCLSKSEFEIFQPTSTLVFSCFTTHTSGSSSQYPLLSLFIPSWWYLWLSMVICPPSWPSLAPPWLLFGPPPSWSLPDPSLALPGPSLALPGPSLALPGLSLALFLPGPALVSPWSSSFLVPPWSSLALPYGISLESGN